MFLYVKISLFWLGEIFQWFTMYRLHGLLSLIILQTGLFAFYIYCVDFVNNLTTWCVNVCLHEGVKEDWFRPQSTILIRTI